jgi:glycosyltransferase involved in cell wall biosynthesis
MHIAIDARAIKSSTGTVLQMLLPHLQRLDTRRRYTVIMKERDRGFWTPDAPNFNTAFVDVEDYSVGVQTRYLALLRALKPDLTWFFMPEQPLLYRGRSVTMFHDFTMQKTPAAGTGRRWRSYLKIPMGRFVFWAAVRKSVLITCPSQYTRRELLQRYGTDPAKVRTIYNGAEMAMPDPKPYPHLFGKFLLYVGQHGWHKNIPRLCEAHQKLLNKHPDLGLILVGKIDLWAQRNKDWCKAQGMRNIHFAGFLPNSQRDWLYGQAEAYVFPSLAEGFGLPGIEAMMHGTPVVSSNATCLPEVYGDAVRYFDPESVDNMAQAIDAVLSDEMLRDELIERGFVQAKRYSYERMAMEILSLFDEATERRQ